MLSELFSDASQPVPVHTVLRTVATARIVLPKAIIRLAAGRHTFSETEQAMVSLLNSISFVS